MSRDFTTDIYTRLLESLLSTKAKFSSYYAFLNSTKESLIILFHDVNILSKNSL